MIDAFDLREKPVFKTVRNINRSDGMRENPGKAHGPSGKSGYSAYFID